MNESPRGREGSGPVAELRWRDGAAAGAGPGVVIGFDAAFIGVGCIAVATAQLLGVEGLREQVLGIPAGLWLIGAGYLIMRGVRATRAAGTPAANTAAGEDSPAVERADGAGDETPGDADGQLCLGFDSQDGPGHGVLPRLTGAANATSGSLLAQAGYRLAEVEACAPQAPGTLGRLVLSAAGIGAGAWSPSSSAPSRAAEAMARWHDQTGWPTLPLRIGVDLPSDLAAMLIRAGGGAGLEWVPLPAGRDDKRECAARALDGVVRMDAVGDIRLTTAEHPAREAGWYDWSRPMPLAYGAVFPTRVDPCVVTLARGWGFEAADAGLIARLIHAAALLSRSGVRLGLWERLRGRRPIDRADTVDPEGMLRANARLVAAMSALTECVCRRRATDPVPLKAAARVLGAWVATTEVSIDPDIRREAAEAALRVLEGEPEAILRAVATRFATYDDGAAFAGLLEADRAIRASEAGPILDPVAFLEAEIELGLPGPMTFGRVAAGLGLVCATIEDAKLDYVCDDLIEEMRYSGWLIGRDDDRRTLIEVMRTVQGARRGGAGREAA